MSRIPLFSEGQIEAFAKVLGEGGSGSDITRVLVDRNIVDVSGESAKWRWLYRIFLRIQQKNKSANMILDFIGSFLDPVRFTGRIEYHREQLNAIHSFSGIEYATNGSFRGRIPARTLGEAEVRP